jgi:hypothetical protein
MPRTSNRRWKGCALCKPWKLAGHGDAARAPWAVQRKVGKKRRWNRHDVDRGE